jgi:hypothetical protein
MCSTQRMTLIRHVDDLGWCHFLLNTSFFRQISKLLDKCTKTFLDSKMTPISDPKKPLVILIQKKYTGCPITRVASSRVELRQVASRRVESRRVASSRVE